LFTVRGMVVSAGTPAVRPDGLLYGLLEFAQVDGSRLSLRNVLVREDQANLVALHSIGEFDFDGDPSASRLRELRRADEPGTTIG
jgi:hypothetical protein